MPDTLTRCDRCGKVVADSEPNGYTSIVFRPLAQPDIVFCSWRCADG